MVEATRVGTVLAHDRKAFRRWRQRLDAVKPRNVLSDSQLEQAVMHIAGMFPGTVSRGVVSG